VARAAAAAVGFDGRRTGVVAGGHRRFGVVGAGVFVEEGPAGYIG
jgi:hypothetical protein